MKSAKKSLIAIVFAISIISLTVIPSSTVSGQDIVTQMPVVRPEGIYMNQIHGNFLGLIRGMQSANFTPDNVYYGVYNSLGTYSYSITGIRERNISVDIRGLTYLLNNSLVKIEADPSISNDAKDYLNALLAEIKNHNSTTIYHKVDADLTISSLHDKKAVTIFYDQDRSVLDTFDMIKNNESITSQPFTGDEVFTNVFMSLVSDKVSGKYEMWNEWKYEDGSDGTMLKRFIERIASHKWLSRELRFLFDLRSVNIMQTMVGPTYHSFLASALAPKVLQRGTFSVSQLRIDNLTLNKIGTALRVQEFDYTYLEHHLLGTLVYNDTNDNGMMDIGVKTIPVGLSEYVSYPTIGDEALYRFDMKSIGSRTYNRPVTTEDVLEFGSEFTNVQGNLEPLGKNQDYSLFNETLDGSHTIDEVSTLFHFSVDNEEGSVALKFDYLIGDWDSAEKLEGLGLNQLMASTVVDSKMQRIIRWRNENSTELDEGFENSSRISKFRFAHTTTDFGEIRLDDIPYLWDQTEMVNATGQLIPMNLINVAYGCISSEADMIRSMRGATSRKTFLYSVSYPKWGGKEILHDPAYVVVSGTASEGEIPTEGNIPGFEIISALLALPLVTLAIRRKRN